jgi:hypothetical protein
MHERCSSTVLAGAEHGIQAAAQSLAAANSKQEACPCYSQQERAQQMLHVWDSNNRSCCLAALPCMAQVREKELELIRKTAWIKTLNLCLVFAVPPAIALVIFATYAFSVGPLTSSMAFVVLSLFNTLRFPLVVLPKALRGASGACKR